MMSVPPDEVKEDGWDWENVNTSLFRRGYRRGKDHAGMRGGVVVFHPYRVKKAYQQEFRRSGIKRDIGFWKEIRERVNVGADLCEFVNLSPHLHAIVIGNPKGHSCKDFVVRYRDDEAHVPKELALKDIVAYLFYLITHTGVLTHLKKYKRGVRRQPTHTVRSFGSLFRADAKKLLGPDEYEKLCKEIAELLGMKYENGELSYPDSCEDMATSEEQPIWVSIYKLGSYLNDEKWLSSLSLTQTNFWLAVYRFWRARGRPPDLEDFGVLLRIPDDVKLYREVSGDEADEL